MAGSTIGDVARTVVIRVAPDEAEGFDVVLRAYAASPAAARRAARPSDQPAASSMALAGEAISTTVLTISTALARNLMLTGTPWPPSRLDPRGWFRRGPGPHDAAPLIRSDQRDDLRRAARAEGVRRRGPGPELDSMVNYIATDWPTLPDPSHVEREPH